MVGSLPRVAHRSDATLVVLNGVRLKGLASGRVLADLTGLEPAEIEGALAELAAADLVVERSGRVSGWAATPAGRQEHQRRLAFDLRTAGCRRELEESYGAFMELNAELLATCTAWQVRDDSASRLNDHSDLIYDQQVLKRLAMVDDAIQPTCERIASLMERMALYGSRLAEARRRVEEGQLDWFARPLLDSYHSVWFELHEDFLMTLGFERAAAHPEPGRGRP